MLIENDTCLQWVGNFKPLSAPVCTYWALSPVLELRIRSRCNFACLFVYTFCSPGHHFDGHPSSSPLSCLNGLAYIFVSFATLNTLMIISGSLNDSIRFHSFLLSCFDYSSDFPPVRPGVLLAVIPPNH